MRYLGILILLFIIFMFLLIAGNEFTFIINILIVVFSYLTVFLWEYSLFDKKIESDFKIRCQRKSFSIFDFIFAVFWTIYIYKILNYGNYTILFYLFVWMFPIIQIIIFFIYQKKKPYMIHLNNTELTLIDRWTQKREIIGLNQIQFDRINKKIKFSFDEGYQISIQTKDYKKEDIDELLDIVIEKSKHPVFIPKNYLEEKTK